MFEGFVSNFLNTWLGDYLEGINTSDLSVAVWNGLVTLKNVRIREDALSFLDLPISVRNGVIEELQIRIPWAQLQSKAIQVEVSNIRILAVSETGAEQKDRQEQLASEIQKKLKLWHQEQWERLMASFEPEQKQADGSETMTSALLFRLISNVYISVQSVDVRYVATNLENQGQQNITWGMYFEKFTLMATDANYKKAYMYDAHGKQHRVLSLNRFNMYMLANEYESTDVFEPFNPDRHAQHGIISNVTIEARMNWNMHKDGHMEASLDLKTQKTPVQLRKSHLNIIAEEAEAITMSRRQQRFADISPKTAEALRADPTPRKRWKHVISCIVKEISRRRERQTLPYLVERRGKRLKHEPVYHQYLDESLNFEEKKKEENTGSQTPSALEIPTRMEEAQASLAKMEVGLELDDIKYFRTTGLLSWTKEHAKQLKELKKPKKVEASYQSYLMGFLGGSTSTENPEASKTGDVEQDVNQLAEVLEQWVKEAPVDKYFTYDVKFELNKGSITLMHDIMRSDNDEAISTELVFDTMAYSLEKNIAEDVTTRIALHGMKMGEIDHDANDKTREVIVSKHASDGEFFKARYVKHANTGKRELRVALAPSEMFIDAELVKRLTSTSKSLMRIGNLSTIQQTFDVIRHLQTETLETFTEVINSESIDAKLNVAAPKIHLQANEQASAKLLADFGELSIQIGRWHEAAEKDTEFETPPSSPESLPSQDGLQVGIVEADHDELQTGDFPLKLALSNVSVAYVDGDSGPYDIFRRTTFSLNALPLERSEKKDHHGHHPTEWFVHIPIDSIRVSLSEDTLRSIVGIGKAFNYSEAHGSGFVESIPVASHTDIVEDHDESVDIDVRSVVSKDTHGRGGTRQKRVQIRKVKLRIRDIHADLKDSMKAAKERCRVEFRGMEFAYQREDNGSTESTLKVRECDIRSRSSEALEALPIVSSDHHSGGGNAKHLVMVQIATKGRDTRVTGTLSTLRLDLCRNRWLPIIQLFGAYGYLPAPSTPRLAPLSSPALSPAPLSPGADRPPLLRKRTVSSTVGPSGRRRGKYDMDVQFESLTATLYSERKKFLDVSVRDVQLEGKFSDGASDLRVALENVESTEYRSNEKIFDMQHALSLDLRRKENLTDVSIAISQADYTYDVYAIRKTVAFFEDFSEVGSVLQSARDSAGAAVSTLTAESSVKFRLVGESPLVHLSSGDYGKTLLCYFGKFSIHNDWSSVDGASPMANLDLDEQHTKLAIVTLEDISMNLKDSQDQSQNHAILHHGNCDILVCRKTATDALSVVVVIPDVECDLPRTVFNDIQVIADVNSPATSVEERPSAQSLDSVRGPEVGVEDADQIRSVFEVRLSMASVALRLSSDIGHGVSNLAVIKGTDLDMKITSDEKMVTTAFEFRDLDVVDELQASVHGAEPKTIGRMEAGESTIDRSRALRVVHESPHASHGNETGLDDPAATQTEIIIGKLWAIYESETWLTIVDFLTSTPEAMHMKSLQASDLFQTSLEVQPLDDGTEGEDQGPMNLLEKPIPRFINLNIMQLSLEVDNSHGTRALMGVKRVESAILLQGNDWNIDGKLDKIWVNDGNANLEEYHCIFDSSMAEELTFKYIYDTTAKQMLLDIDMSKPYIVYLRAFVDDLYEILKATIDINNLIQDLRGKYVAEGIKFNPKVKVTDGFIALPIHRGARPFIGLTCDELLLSNRHYDRDSDQTAVNEFLIDIKGVCAGTSKAEASVREMPLRPLFKGKKDMQVKVDFLYLDNYIDEFAYQIGMDFTNVALQLDNNKYQVCMAFLTGNLGIAGGNFDMVKETSLVRRDSGPKTKDTQNREAVNFPTGPVIEGSTDKDLKFMEMVINIRDCRLLMEHNVGHYSHVMEHSAKLTCDVQRATIDLTTIIHAGDFAKNSTTFDFQTPAISVYEGLDTSDNFQPITNLPVFFQPRVDTSETSLLFNFNRRSTIKDSQTKFIVHKARLFFMPDVLYSMAEFFMNMEDEHNEMSLAYQKHEGPEDDAYASSLAVDMLEPDLVVLVDHPDYPLDMAMIFRACAVLQLKFQPDAALVCFSELSDIEAFSCILSREMDTKMNLIEPFQISLQSEWDPVREKEKISMSVMEAFVRFSYSDARLMNAILSVIHYGVTNDEKSEPATPEAEFTIHQAFEHLEQEIQREKMVAQRSMLQSKNAVYTKRDISIHVDGLAFNLLDDTTKYDCPVARLKIAQIGADIRLTERGTVQSAATMTLAADFYNTRTCNWDSLLESSQLRMVYNSDDNSQNRHVSLQSDDVLNITISRPLLSTIRDLSGKMEESIRKRVSVEEEDLRRAFLPFVLVNKTGTTVKVHLWDNKGHQTKTLTLAADEMNEFDFEDKVDPKNNIRKLFVDDDERADRGVSFMLGKSRESRVISVDKAGMQSVVLKAIESQDHYRLLSSMEIVTGQKVITISGHIKVVNTTDIDLEVALLDGPTRQTRHVNKLVNNEEFFVPMDLALETCELAVRPANRENGVFAWSSPGLSIFESTEWVDAEIAGLNRSTTATDHVFLTCARSSATKAPILMMSNRSFQASATRHGTSLCTFTITPAAVLDNQLPVSLWIQLDGYPQAFELKKGALFPIHQQDLREPTALRVALDGYSWSEHQKIKHLETGQRLEGYVRMESAQRTLVDINMTLENTSGLCCIYFWMPYWIVNRTGVPLLFRPARSRTLFPGQTEENHHASMVDPLLVNFDPTMNDHTVSVTCTTGTATKLFWFEVGGIDAVGRTGNVNLVVEDPHLPNGRVEYQVGLKISRLTKQGRFSRTKVALFMPQIILMNHTDAPLHCLQEFETKTGAIAHVLQPSCLSPFHWTSTQEELYLCLRLPPKTDEHGHTTTWRWSGGFRVDQGGESYLKIMSEDRKQFVLVRVMVEVRKAAFYIHIFDDDGVGPSWIFNHSRLSLACYQKDVHFITDIKPESKIRYAWDSLKGEAEMHLFLDGDKSMREVVLRLDEAPKHYNFRYENPFTIQSVANGSLMDIMETPMEGWIPVLSKATTGADSQFWLLTKDHKLKNKQLGKYLTVQRLSGGGAEYRLCLTASTKGRDGAQMWNFGNDGSITNALDPRILLMAAGDMILVYHLPKGIPARPDDVEYIFSRKNLHDGSGMVSFAVESQGPVRILHIYDPVTQKIDSTPSKLSTNKSVYSVRSQMSVATSQNEQDLVTSSESMDLAAASAEPRTRSTYSGHVRTPSGASSQESVANDPMRTSGTGLASQTESELIEDAEMELRGDLGGIGLSLVDDMGREILYLCMIGVRTTLEQRDRLMQYDLRIQDVQIDNQINAGSSFPVAVFRKPDPREKVRHPHIYISFSRLLDQPANTQTFRYFTLLIQRTTIMLDEEMLVHLNAFSDPERRTHLRPVEEEDCNIDELTSFGLMPRGSDGNNPSWRESFRLYMDVLILQPISMRVSFRRATQMSHSDGEVLKRRYGVDLPNFFEAPFPLQLVYERQLYGPAFLITRTIYKRYMQDILSRTYRNIGYTDVMGNVQANFSTIGAGFKDLFYEPYNGLISSPKDFLVGLRKGTGSFASSLVAGMASTAATAASSANDILSNMTMDQDYVRERQKARNQHDTKGGAKFRRGVDGFVQGFASGVTGIFNEPRKGMQSGGIAGGMAGVGKGLIGVVAKPLAGFSELVTDSSGAVSDMARKEEVQQRIRPPRVPSGRHGRLNPYSLYHADGRMQLLLKRPHEVYVNHWLVDRRQAVSLFLTEQRVILFEKMETEWLRLDLHGVVAAVVLPENDSYILIRSEEISTRAHNRFRSNISIDGSGYCKSMIKIGEDANAADVIKAIHSMATRRAEDDE
eukprot:Clim_evm51s210 gene=Clim_evmTU51s210